jgi:hypothetical protein
VHQIDVMVGNRQRRDFIPGNEKYSSSGNNPWQAMVTRRYFIGKPPRLGARLPSQQRLITGVQRSRLHGRLASGTNGFSASMGIVAVRGMYCSGL